MKYNKLLVLFFILLPMAVATRFVQLINTVEAETGFFIKEYTALGNGMLIAIFIFALAGGLFPFLSFRCPAHPPKHNIFLTVSSVFLAISIVFELLTEQFPATIGSVPIILLRCIGFCCAAFFVIYGIEKYLPIKLPELSYAIPVIYMLLRIICDFISIATIAFISDNLLLMASYCSVVWFVLNFAKLYIGIDDQKNFRKIMSGAMMGVIFCYTQSIPHLLINILTDNSLLHTSLQANLNIFAMGTFMLCFMISHFSKDNLS